ncbi:hypothetical protein AAMO2058_000849100 [Amorphochlora amoebiformis]
MSKKLPDLPKSDSTPRLGRFPSYARGTANSNRRKESQNANFRCKPRRRHGSAGNFIHMERRRSISNSPSKDPQGYRKALSLQKDPSYMRGTKTSAKKSLQKSKSPTPSNASQSYSSIFKRPPIRAERRASMESARFESNLIRMGARRNLDSSSNKFKKPTKRNSLKGSHHYKNLFHKALRETGSNNTSYSSVKDSPRNRGRKISPKTSKNPRSPKAIPNFMKSTESWAAARSSEELRGFWQDGELSTLTGAYTSRRAQDLAPDSVRKQNPNRSRSYKIMRPTGLPPRPKSPGDVGRVFERAAHQHQHGLANFINKIGNLSISSGSLEPSEEDEPEQNEQRFLHGESFCDNCGFLASSILDWNSHNRWESKENDDYALSIYRNKIATDLSAIGEELAKKLEGKHLVRGAVRWLCHNVQGKVNSKTPESKGFDYGIVRFEANAILRSGRADSYDFAIMLMAILKEVDIPSLIVRGYGKYLKIKEPTESDSPNHCWNIVHVPDEGWRLIDVAMCSGSWRENSIREFSDVYMFMHPQQFIWQHYPEEAMGSDDLLEQIQDKFQLQMLTTKISKMNFWSWITPSVEFMQDCIFLHPQDFVEKIEIEQSKINFDIACTQPQEFDAEMHLRGNNKNLTECVTVRPTSVLLKGDEKNGVGMFSLLAAFPYRGTYEIEVFSRRIKSNTYKLNFMFRIQIKVKNGIFDHHSDPNLCLAYVRKSKTRDEELRDVIRRSMVTDPSDAFHFLRYPFILNLRTPMEVTRVAYVSNVFWCLLKSKMILNSREEARRFYCKVIIDKSAEFSIFFEIEGQFHRAMEFKGQLFQAHSPEAIALKSSYSAQQTFLWNIQDSEAQQKAHKSITKRDGDLDMDQYGRCITSELQIKRITKEEFKVSFDLTSTKAYKLQPMCYSGWHNKSEPLPSHCIEFDSKRQASKYSNEGTHVHWRVSFKLPEKAGLGSRWSMQFNVCLAGGTNLFRFAMTYYYKVKIGSSVEKFHFT